MRDQNLKVGDSVKISTPWADEEYPDCRGVVIDMRFGGSIVVVQTEEGRPPRCLHVQYLD